MKIRKEGSSLTIYHRPARPMQLNVVAVQQYCFKVEYFVETDFEGICIVCCSVLLDTEKLLAYSVRVNRHAWSIRNLIKV